MEFRQAVKNLNRMCDSYHEKHSCRFCPFEHYSYNGKTGCMYYIMSNPEMAEEMVTKWTEENVPKTNLDELTRIIKRFCGNAVIVRPQALYPGISIEPPEEAVDKFKDWLNEEYKENSQCPEK